jgi:hypothetical protein
VSVEEWRWVVGSDTHQVSDLGRVRAWTARPSGVFQPLPRLLKPHCMLAYLAVCVRVNGRSRSHYVHRLVLDAFVGPAPAGTQGSHFPDSDTVNCRLSNLRWATTAENGMDKRAHNAGPAAVAARLAELQALHPHLRAQVNQDVRPTRLYTRPRGFLSFYTSRKEVA